MEGRTEGHKWGQGGGVYSGDSDDSDDSDDSHDKGYGPACATGALCPSAVSVHGGLPRFKSDMNEMGTGSLPWASGARMTRMSVDRNHALSKRGFRPYSDGFGGCWGVIG